VALVVGQDLRRRGEVDELDALALRLGQLLFVDDHLLAAPSHDHVDVLGAETP
jgi:hypothetical protein